MSYYSIRPSSSASFSSTSTSATSVLDDENSSIRQQKLDKQRALLEQKQRRKRQEPLMVQPNPEAKPRRSKPRRSEEQAPLVESRLSITSDVILDGLPGCCHILDPVLSPVLDKTELRQRDVAKAQTEHKEENGTDNCAYGGKPRKEDSFLDLDLLKEESSGEREEGRKAVNC